MSDGARTKRMVVGALLGVCLSVGLLYLLFRSFSHEWLAYQERLLELRWWWVVGVVISTALHCQITAHKWRIVTLTIEADGDLGRGLFAMYSAFIALLGQVIPLQLAILAGRSIALRLHADIPMRRGAYGAIFDQGFDVLVPAILIVPGLLYFLGYVGALTAATFSILLATAIAAVLYLQGAWVVRQALDFAERIMPTSYSKRLGLRRIIDAPEDTFDNAILSRLYLWSAIRCANLVLRAWLVAWCFHLDISWIALLYGHCAVTFTLVLSLIPGGLGLTEWGWVGMLNLAGVDSVDAVHYALSSRILIVSALVVVNLMGGLLLLVRGFQRK